MSYVIMIFSPSKNKFLNDIQLILVRHHVDLSMKPDL